MITKLGKPVARLVPVEEATPSIFGRMRGAVTIHGDIVGPTGEEWHAHKGILYVGEMRSEPSPLLPELSARQRRWIDDVARCGEAWGSIISVWEVSLLHSK